MTRWRAVRTGSELFLPAPTSLASSEPLPDSVMCCERRTKPGLSERRRIPLPSVSERKTPEICLFSTTNNVLSNYFSTNEIFQKVMEKKKEKMNIHWNFFLHNVVSKTRAVPLTRHPEDASVLFRCNLLTSISVLNQQCFSHADTGCSRAGLCNNVCPQVRWRGITGEQMRREYGRSHYTD